MTIPDLLNTDVGDFSTIARNAWRWWLSELQAMAPRALVRALQARPRLVAEPDDKGGFRLTRDGREVLAPASGIRRPAPVVLKLSSRDVLMRETPARRLAERDLRRMVELDIDRMTPFRADQVFVDVSTGAGSTNGVALVAIVPRAKALSAVATAREAGLEPRAITVAGSGPEAVGIDFLPVMRSAGAVQTGRSRRDWIWAIPVGLLCANLVVFAVRDASEMAALKAEVEQARAVAAPVAALRARVLAEEARRADVRRRVLTGEPLRIIDQLTTLLPDGVWVQNLAWNGASVRISGYRQPGADVVTVLRSSPGFNKVRPLSVEMVQTAHGGWPFDVMADARPPVAP